MLTLDLETAPQLRYVDPANDGVDWDDDWLDSLVTDIDFREAVQNGEGVLAATKAKPALHPTTMHIVAASFGGIDRNNRRKVDVLTLRDYGTTDDYAELLAAAAETAVVQACLDRVAWAVKERPPLVTFNGKTADIWWLQIRALILKLEATAPTRLRKIPWGSVQYPYRHDPHLDLRLYLNNGNRFGRGGLSWWADALGIESEESGQHVWEWVRAGEWGKLESYGQKEGHTLIDLYEIVKPWL